MARALAGGSVGLPRRSLQREWLLVSLRDFLHRERVQDVGVRPYVSSKGTDTWTCARCGVINLVTEVVCRNPMRVCSESRPGWASFNHIPLRGAYAPHPAVQRPARRLVS